MAGKRKRPWRTFARKVLRAKPECVTCGRAARYVVRDRDPAPGQSVAQLPVEAGRPMCSRCYGAWKYRMGRKRLGLPPGAGEWGGGIPNIPPVQE